LSRQRAFQNCRSQSSYSDCYCDAKITIQTRCRPRQSILFMIRNDSDRESDILPLQFRGVNGISHPACSDRRQML
jgi:hypothetical protein